MWCRVNADGCCLTIDQGMANPLNYNITTRTHIKKQNTSVTQPKGINNDIHYTPHRKLPIVLDEKRPINNCKTYTFSATSHLSGPFM